MNSFQLIENETKFIPPTLFQIWNKVAKQAAPHTRTESPLFFMLL